MTFASFESCIAGLPPMEAARWGFRAGASGTHSSRTIMLRDLAILMEDAPAAAARGDYARLVVGDNCLGKRTAANRRTALQRLTELYGLDRRLLLFRVLRDRWEHHESSRPRLALLLALARDPLLRATADAVLGCPFGEQLSRQAVTAAVSAAAGDRLNPRTTAQVVRYALSSWTQSGHLRGRSAKIRQRVPATPAAAAYALLLGYAAGRRGALLFETPWCAVLDAGPGGLAAPAAAANRLGLLDLKQSGPMIDVSFGMAHGAYRQAG